jgi:hypothetical protein
MSSHGIDHGETKNFIAEPGTSQERPNGEFVCGQRLVEQVSRRFKLAGGGLNSRGGILNRLSLIRFPPFNRSLAVVVVVFNPIVHQCCTVGFKKHSPILTKISDGARSV